MKSYTRLHTPRKNDQTLFDQFEQVFKTTGEYPKEYDPVFPPEGSEYVWRLWEELRENTKPSGYGPALITYHDILAYQAITGVKLPLGLIKLIQSMDRTYLVEYNKVKDAKNGS